MRNIYKSNELVVLLLGAALAGCGGGGGGGGSSPPPSGGSPSPAPAPAPAPTPAPSPGGTPPLPTLSSTVINLDDNHQVGVKHWEDGDTATGGQGADMVGLTCDINPTETYHVHTHLSVFLDGQQIAIPGQIGIVPQPQGGHCFYQLHTHDKSGKLHVEAAAPGTFTLGQIMDIWGQPLQGDNFAGITGKEIVVYVTDAGVVTQASGDWRNIELTTHREITVQIGTPITEIPNYTWSAN